MNVSSFKLHGSVTASRLHCRFAVLDRPFLWELATNLFVVEQR
jgi:hypothetical protein